MDQDSKNVDLQTVKEDFLSECRELMKTLKFVGSRESLNKFACVYCGKLCSHVYESKCKHIFCKNCIDKSALEHKRCPLDSEIINGEDVTRNVEIENQIKRLLVYCPYREKGCQEMVQLTNISNHIGQCQTMAVKCPQGCNIPVKAKELENHLRFLCDHRHVTCEFCDRAYILAYKQKHIDECLRFPVECPNQCGTQDIPQEEVPVHLKVCAVKLQLCRYQHLGCQFQGFGNQLKTHEKDVIQHFRIMADGYSRLNLHFDILLQETKGNVVLLQNDNFALRETMKQIMKQSEKLQMSVEALTEKLSNLQVHVYKILKTNEIATNNQAEALSTENISNDYDSSKYVSATELNTISQEMLTTMQDDLLEKIKQQENRVHDLSLTNYSGVLIWKISDYQRLKRESLAKNPAFLFSEPFYTDRYGYQLRAKVYLGGDGDATGTYISVYIILMRGPWDDILLWPFPNKFTISILDQRNTTHKANITEALSPNSGPSFQKPAMAMNIGAGVTKFVAHNAIETSGTYLQNDTIYIKIAISQWHHKSKKAKK